MTTFTWVEWIEAHETEFEYYWTKEKGWTKKEVNPHYVLRKVNNK